MEHIVIKVFRTGMIESIHEGFIAVVDGEGNPKAGFGNVYYETFLRSSAKPFQVYPLLFKKGVEKFGFTAEEIAVMCSSHTGQAKHVELVRSILRKIGLDESYLQCGIHTPMYTPEAEKILKEGREYEPVHNNCSGKHAGMLAQTVLYSTDSATYLSLENPVQQYILNSISLFSDEPAEQLPAGIDGCSAPIYLMPLHKMALMFARLAQGADHHLRKIRDSIVSDPFLIAGDGRFDTAFMNAVKGRFVSKTGAEGVQCVGIIDGGPRPEYSGWGLAVKIMDGNIRAKGPAAVEALDQLGVLKPEDKLALRDLKEPAIKNHAGLTVGKIEPSFELNIL